MRRSAAATAAVLLLTAAAPASHALTVVPLGATQLSRGALCVVRGAVVAQRLVRFAVGPGLFTESTIRVDEVLASRLPSQPSGTLLLRIPGGGALEPGNQVPGMPQFDDGEEVILFLEPQATLAPDLSPGWLPVGLNQGVWRRDLHGDWRSTPQPGLLPLAGSTTPPGPLDDAAIRALAGGR